jgi:hypothetical protein
MSIIYEERLPDSPYVETITRGRTVSDSSPIRPAESRWHMVLRRLNDNVQALIVGPLPNAGVVSYTEGAELLWIKFRLGTFMPHLPPRTFRDVETILPGAASQSFWLNGSAWQFPDYENVETFIDRLVCDDVLLRDPVVDGVLQGHPQERSSRTTWCPTARRHPATPVGREGSPKRLGALPLGLRPRRRQHRRW